MWAVTRPPTAAPAQRVCPRCSRIAHTDDRRCPFCGRGYTRRPLASLVLVLLVFAAGILGGMALMFAAVADRVEDELDTRVVTIERDIDRSVRDVGDDLARRLDQRLRERGLLAP